MTPEQKLTTIRSIAAEIIGEQELVSLLESNKEILAYDGFEPSGNIHIAQGLMRAITVNKLTQCNIRFIFWVADWFGLMNNKMGGDLDKIRVVGEYFIEVWKACGMDLDKVDFRWASEHMDKEYWLRVLRIGTLNSVDRLTRCAQIMGRSEKDKLTGAQIFYPCMQASDIFHLNVDIAQLGMDQRKVNVLAREVAPKLGYKKPIAIHHHMLSGLHNPTNNDLSGAEAAIAKKMSKSNPDSAIFMTDTTQVIQKKFNKAYCPQGDAVNNPVLEYFKYIIFERYDTITIRRDEQFGGDLDIPSYQELEKAFMNQTIHPADLKKTAAYYIDVLIDGVRNHFKNNQHAAILLEQVKSFEVSK